MTVANIDNGNIYMLVDKSKINEKAGWKASYESIQIVTCTEAEYKLWQENTNEDFTPKDENQTYLHSDTYYYVYDTNVNYITNTEFKASIDAQSETNNSLSGRITANGSNIGDKNNLTTVNKNNLVSAVNELNDNLS
jgi:hypothetical protein